MTIAYKIYSEVRDLFALLSGEPSLLVASLSLAALSLTLLSKKDEIKRYILVVGLLDVSS